MNTKGVLNMIVIIGIFMVAGTLQADMHEGHEHKGSMMKDAPVMAPEVGDETGPVKVGNKICPVSGEDVSEMGDPVEVEYNGKIYNMCCTMCKKDFLKNPEKYSAIATAEVAADMMEDEDGEDEGMEDHHDHDHEHHHDHE